MITKRILKQIIQEEIKKYYKPTEGVKPLDKSERWLVYYYNEENPSGGDWARASFLPGRKDIKGSIDNPKRHMDFILDYAQIMADLKNAKVGNLQFKPDDFVFDTLLAIDKETGDIFGPVKRNVLTAKERGEEKPEKSITGDVTKIGKKKIR